MAEISVIGLKFHAFHGCHPGEQKTGGAFEVDIHCETLGVEEALSDQLIDAVDYVRLMEIAGSEMEVRSNLIETVAYRIMHAIKREFEQVQKVSVTVRKLNAPVHFDHDHVSVRYTHE